MSKRKQGASRSEEFNVATKTIPVNPPSKPGVVTGAAKITMEELQEQYKQQQQTKKYFKSKYTKTLLRKTVVREHVRQATERSRRRAYEAGKTYHKNLGIRFFKRALAAFKVSRAKTLAHWATYRASNVILFPFTKNTSYKQINETVKQEKAELESQVEEEFTQMVVREEKEPSEATLQEAIAVVRARKAWLENKEKQPFSVESYNDMRENHIRVPGFSHEFISKIKEDKDIEERKNLLEKLAEENYTNTYGNEGQFLDRLYKDKHKNALPNGSKEFLKKLHKARFIYQVQRRIAADAAGRSRSLENKALLLYLADVIALRRELIATGISEEAIENLLGASPMVQDHRAVIVNHFIAKTSEIVSSKEVHKTLEFLDQLDTKNMLSELSREDIEEILKEEELPQNNEEYIKRVYEDARKISYKNMIIKYINDKYSSAYHKETEGLVNALLKESIVLKLPEEQILQLLNSQQNILKSQGIEDYISAMNREAQWMIDPKLITIDKYAHLYKLSKREKEYLYKQTKKFEKDEQWESRVKEAFIHYTFNRNYIINYYIKQKYNSSRMPKVKYNYNDVKKEITDTLLQLLEAAPDCSITKDIWPEQNLKNNSEVVTQQLEEGKIIEECKKIINSEEFSLTIKEFRYLYEKVVRPLKKNLQGTWIENTEPLVDAFKKACQNYTLNRNQIISCIKQKYSHSGLPEYNDVNKEITDTLLQYLKTSLDCSITNDIWSEDKLNKKSETVIQWLQENEIMMECNKIAKSEEFSLTTEEYRYLYKKVVRPLKKNLQGTWIENAKPLVKAFEKACRDHVARRKAIIEAYERTKPNKKPLNEDEKKKLSEILALQDKEGVLIAVPAEAITDLVSNLSHTEIKTYIEGLTQNVVQQKKGVEEKRSSKEAELQNFTVASNSGNASTPRNVPAAVAPPAKSKRNKVKA